MHKTANWQNREDYIFTIEKSAKVLNIIADACGNGAYTSTEDVEEALDLVTENISKATESLRTALWPDDKSAQDGSPIFLEYRRAFDAWIDAVDADDGRVGDADDTLRAAIDAVLARQAQTWHDVAELGIVAHDYAWNRRSQSFRARDCPEDILKALIVAVREMAAKTAGLAAKRHLPPSVPPAPPSITVTN